MRKIIAIPGITAASLLIVFGCGSNSTVLSGNDDYLTLSVDNQRNNSLTGYVTETDADSVILTGSNIKKIVGTTTQLEVVDTLLLAYQNEIFWGSSSELEAGNYTEDYDMAEYTNYGKYGSLNLSDSNSQTCWAEGSESNGIGAI